MQTNTSKTPAGEIASGDPGEGPAPRGFVDSRGCAWTVYERTRRDPEGRMTFLLVFECSSWIRCVRNYPRNWHTLSPDALERLSWHS